MQKLFNLFFLVVPFLLKARETLYSQYNTGGNHYSVVVDLHQPDTGRHYWLLGVECVTKYNNTVFIPLDTLDSDMLGFSYKGRSSFIQSLGIGGLLDAYCCFQDSVSGYVYGNMLGYGTFPFIIRTTNGGITWHKAIELPYSANIHPEYFYFRGAYGFILLPVYSELSNNKLGYFYTRDGGNSWNKGTHTIQMPGYTVEGWQMQVSDGGLTSVTLDLHNNKNWQLKKRIILQSKNYGESFVMFK